MVAVTTSANKTGYAIFQDALPTAVDGGVPRFKTGVITLDATADDGDTCSIDIYEKFGMTRFMGIDGWIQTTANSVIAPEAPTTTCDGTKLVITIGGSTDNKQRTYVIYGI